MMAVLSCGEDAGADPDGTMSKTMDSSNSSSRLIFGSAYVYLTSSSNLSTSSNCEIAYFGQVKGLGGIKIPQSGWNTSATASANTGYVVRLNDGTYARIFVSTVTTGTYMARTCVTCQTYVQTIKYMADVKYQYPFVP